MKGLKYGMKDDVLKPPSSPQFFKLIYNGLNCYYNYDLHLYNCSSHHLSLQNLSGSKFLNNTQVLTMAGPGRVAL